MWSYVKELGYYVASTTIISTMNGGFFKVEILLFKMMINST